MALCSTTLPSVALFVCSVSAVASTCTVSAVEPTSKVAFTVAGVLICRTIFVRAYRLKPVFSMESV